MYHKDFMENLRFFFLSPKFQGKTQHHKRGIFLGGPDLQRGLAGSIMHPALVSQRPCAAAVASGSPLPSCEMFGKTMLFLEHSSPNILSGQIY